MILQLSGAIPPVALTVPTGVSGAMALNILLQPLSEKANGPPNVGPRELVQGSLGLDDEDRMLGTNPVGDPTMTVPGLWLPTGVPTITFPLEELLDTGVPKIILLPAGTDPNPPGIQKLD